MQLSCHSVAVVLTLDSDERNKNKIYINKNTKNTQNKQYKTQ